MRSGVDILQGILTTINFFHHLITEGLARVWLHMEYSIRSVDLFVLFFQTCMQLWAHQPKWYALGVVVVWKAEIRNECLGSNRRKEDYGGLKHISQRFMHGGHAHPKASTTWFVWLRRVKGKEGFAWAFEIVDSLMDLEKWEGKFFSE